MFLNSVLAIIKFVFFSFCLFQKLITKFLSPLDDHLKGVRALLDLIARLGVGEVARLEKDNGSR